MIDELNTHKEMLRCAQLLAALSKAKRANVGCLIERQGIVLVFGFNRLTRNDTRSEETEGPEGLVTRQELLHAEMTALMEAARKGIAVDGGTAYVTHICCPLCLAALNEAGIKKIYYQFPYRLEHKTHELLKALGDQAPLLIQIEDPPQQQEPVV